MQSRSYIIYIYMQCNGSPRSVLLSGNGFKHSTSPQKPTSSLTYGQSPKSPPTNQLISLVPNKTNETTIFSFFQAPLLLGLSRLLARLPARAHGLAGPAAGPRTGSSLGAKVTLLDSIGRCWRCPPTNRTVTGSRCMLKGPSL